MDFIKKILVLNQLSDGFSVTNKRISGIARIETDHGVSTLYLSVINVAAATDGYFIFCVSDYKRKLYFFDLGKRPSSVTKTFDGVPFIENGFAAGLVFVKDDAPVIVAYSQSEGIKTNSFDFKKCVAEKLLSEKKEREKIAESTGANSKCEKLKSENAKPENPKCENSEHTNSEYEILKCECECEPISEKSGDSAARCRTDCSKKNGDKDENAEDDPLDPLIKTVPLSPVKPPVTPSASPELFPLISFPVFGNENPTKQGDEERKGENGDNENGSDDCDDGRIDGENGEKDFLDKFCRIDYDDEAVATENYYELEDEIRKKVEIIEDTDRRYVRAENERSACGSQKETQKNVANGKRVQNETNSDSGTVYSKSNPYYLSARKELEDVFSRFPPEETLQKNLPDSKWAKINYSETKYYVVGLINENGKPRYICYGVPGEYKKEPPKELKGFCSFVPLSVFDMKGDGYFMMFQDAITGDCIKMD